MRLQSLQCCFSKGVYAFSLVVVSFSSLELILVYSSETRTPQVDCWRGCHHGGGGMAAASVIFSDSI